jgi:hypothetical protein
MNPDEMYYLNGPDEFVNPNEPQWISVKDKLPEIGKEVIVFSPRSNQGKGRVTALSRYIRYEGAVDFYWDNSYGGRNVYVQEAITHWMPLPKPPQI